MTALFLGDARWKQRTARSYGLRSPWGIVPETGPLARWRTRIAYVAMIHLRTIVLVSWTIFLLAKELPRLYSDFLKRRQAVFHDEDQE